MKEKISWRLKFIGLLAAAAVCLCLSLTSIPMASSEYSSWQSSFHAPAERLYDHVDFFFSYVYFLILSGGLFLLSVDKIVRRFRKSERAPSPLLAAESKIHSPRLAHTTCGINAVGPGCFRKNGGNRRGRRGPHGLWGAPASWLAISRAAVI